MICNNCGRSPYNEEANFCEYCGSPLREHLQMAYHMEPQRQTIHQTEPGEQPISFLNWLGSYGLLFIPVVSWVMLFVWAFSNTTPKTKKNWARATLIFMGVIVIITMYLMGSSVYRDILNGNLDLSSYSQGLS